MIERLVPFDAEVLHALSARHQEQLWPAQPVVAVFLAVLIVLWWKRATSATMPLVLSLAVLWVFNAVAWEWRVHGMLNWVGPWLAAFLGAQAALLAGWALRREQVVFAAQSPARSVLAAALIVLALITIGVPGSPLGLPPAPVVAITLGVMLLARGPVPVWLLLAPAVWWAYALCVAWVLALWPDVVVLGLSGVGMVLALCRSGART